MTWLPGLCLDEVSSGGGSSGGGEGAPQHGVRAETVLPEALCGEKTPNLRCGCCAPLSIFMLSKGKRCSTSSSPAWGPHFTQRTSWHHFALLWCVLSPGNSVARKRQFTLWQTNARVCWEHVEKGGMVTPFPFHWGSRLCQHYGNSHLSPSHPPSNYKRTISKQWQHCYIKHLHIL